MTDDPTVEGQWVASRMALVADDNPINIEAAKVGSHDALIDACGDTRISGVSWVIFDVGNVHHLTKTLHRDDANVVAAHLIAHPAGRVVVALCSTRQPTTTDLDHAKDLGNIVRVDTTEAAPILCPGCGRQLFGEVAIRGACLACFPELPAGEHDLGGTQP